MKALLIIALYLLVIIMGEILPTNPCPVKGDKDNPKFQHTDSLKNRNYKEQANDSINLYWIMFPVIHMENQWSFNERTYVTLTGYILGVKWGGAETCNCHNKDTSQEDYHIELIPDSAYKGKPMICEVNRYVRCISWTALKKLIHHNVTISGNLFYDAEHWQNAVNSNPQGTNLWRQTCWELHPVLSIKGN